MWIARQIAAFICVDTGSLRDLDYVLRRVRYTVLIQLRHARQRAWDIWTVTPAPPAIDSVHSALAHLAAQAARIQL